MVSVWVVYDYQDEQPYALSIHESATDALEEIIELERGQYCLWPFGVDLATAITDWVECIPSKAFDRSCP